MLYNIFASTFLVAIILTVINSVKIMFILCRTEIIKVPGNRLYPELQQNCKVGTFFFFFPLSLYFFPLLAGPHQHQYSSTFLSPYQQEFQGLLSNSYLNVEGYNGPNSFCHTTSSRVLHRSKISHWREDDIKLRILIPVTKAFFILENNKYSCSSLWKHCK